MKILCIFGQHNYGDPSRGESYEYANFLPVFKRVGEEVVFFESWNRDRFSDFSELNHALLATVECECPDIVFFVLMGYEIWLETLEILKDSGVVMVNWGTDDSWKYAQFSRFFIPAVDYYLTTSAAAFRRAREDGLNNILPTQWGANSESLAAPCLARQCTHQVSFVGSAYGNRPQWIARLRERGIEVSCFGHGWEHGAVSTEEMQRILRESVIVLNFGDSGLQMKGLSLYRDRQIKARVFEVPGRGGFLVTEAAAGLDQYFVPNEEIVIFHGMDELVGKIRRYLSDHEARDRIAAKGHQRVVREHTYDARFSAIFERIRLDLRRDQTAPKTSDGGKVDWTRFDAAVASHRPKTWMLWLRAALVGTCSLAWGRRRGARAARRIVHEFSWRLCGRKTFSAAGLPGRLFYHES